MSGAWATRRTTKHMNQKYFSDLMPVLANRARLSAIGELAFANQPLQRHLSEIFSRPYGAPGAFLADPTFEAVFGWKAGDKKMSELAGNLLTTALVNAMDDPPAELKKDYRFAKNLKPYAHQLEAWRILADENPKSLIVASGTGSGKTECFMVPILDSLARERGELGKLIGVRALFLYPLNALINSQRERFRAWTHAFGDEIRFCLYNGNTPETEPARMQRDYKNEVLDRKSLRSQPPPLLVTNATMLEYMLVRSVDAPIIRQSQGKLKWVVLDEAHTYIGSQAAEAALLIRRVLLAFGVKPEEVRFVATSATIGDPQGEAGQKLRQFLADVAGVNQENVYLVAGEREIPILPQQTEVSNLSLAELTDTSAANSEILFDELTKNETARKIRHRFVGRPDKSPVATLSEVCAEIFSDKREFSAKEKDEALGWLDLLSQARERVENEREPGQPFLPLRAHIFHRTLPGLWACADADCQIKNSTALDDREWFFGQVYFEPRKHCECGSPVYEVIKCDGCGTVHLRAGKDRTGRVTHLRQFNALDEFETETEPDDSTVGEIETAADAAPVGQQDQILIVNQNLDGVDSIKIERGTRQLVDSGENTLTVWAKEDGSYVEFCCPVCDEKETFPGKAFRASRVGAPFFIGGILPTLLEYAPDADKPADHPFRGRRLLSFNDSRQGTARIAARLQQESERSRIRGLIYHISLNETASRADSQEQNIENQIAQFESVLNDNLPAAARALLQEQLNSHREQLNALSLATAIAFSDLANKLTQQGRDFERMLTQYRRYAPGTFSEASGAIELASTFLIREFGRRPKRSNNLETLGLIAVLYPALQTVEQVPAAVIQAANFNLAEWRDFLKICLDFFVRGGGSLEIPRTWRSWLGTKFPQTFLVGRDEENVAGNQRRWLRAKRGAVQSNIVRLLAYVLKADIETPEGEDRIDTVLQAAWQDLISHGLLRQTAAEGRVLKPYMLAFAPIKTAWICPVTRRFLDTTLRGVTPYLPKEKPSEKTAVCEKVEMPLYDKPFGDATDSLEAIKNGREWLSGQETVSQLRAKGTWSVSNDRVIELAPYFTAAEHSAQQDSKKLERYEKDFKEGSLNLLSCSTTMEMGIDIGGISVVAMNNVPPHPANYLQRAGRAGRRRETQSLSMTVCKANPHDQNVFRNTRWAFDRQLPAPKVSLDSPIIVQRHLNSFLLTRFFRQKFSASGQESTKLTCGMFFLGDNSLAAEFSAWCRHFGAEIEDRELADGLHHLVQNSVLENQNKNQLLESAAGALEEIADKWLTEWRLLEAEAESLAADDERSAAARAVDLQKRRLSDEYLLREQATRGFLPGYGFPSNIASFDNMNIQQWKRDAETREDNRYRRRELASRDVITALREYAPGSQVVIDGLTYVSAGVTLNWHVPAHTEEIKEIQNIRWAWRCRDCGASGSTHSLDEARTCGFCGAEIGARGIREFLEPAGFAVDFFKEPSNDVSSQSFIPVEPAWIDADGEWFPLNNPAYGRFRTTTRGHVFNQSRGINGTGYALCLECGRAEPMLMDESLPKAFTEPHRKLRRAKNETGFCPGSFNNWKIKRGIALGRQGWTDIFELQLKDAAGICLNDETVALTLAVVLRDALAELLGIQATELGCDIKPARNEEGGRCHSIVIFDRYAAGYASSADRFLDKLFRRAWKHLHCAAQCDSVCPQCVLDFDQRFAADKLDRHAALAFLTEEWLSGFRLHEELRFFGEESCLEQNSFAQAVAHAAANRQINSFRFFATGTPADWDTAMSPLREQAYKIAGRNINVEIMVPENALDSLYPEDRRLLASLADAPRISVRAYDFEPRAGQGWVLAEAFAANAVMCWATVEQKALVFNESWATGSDLLVKTGNGQPFPDAGRILSSSELNPQPIFLGDTMLNIQNELDGLLQGFGKRFWNYLAENYAPAADLFADENNFVESVFYNDRYIHSPLAVARIFHVINELREKLGEKQASAFALKITTTRKDDNSKSPYLIKHDWNDSEDRDRMLRLLFAQTDLRFSLEVKNIWEVQHGRFLEINFSGGEKLKIQMDQGVSYWDVAYDQPHSAKSYNFYADDAAQLNKLLNLNCTVAGVSYPTQIFLKISS
jgi:DEAD/DEAH box helicase domain-containing protein